MIFKRKTSPNYYVCLYKNGRQKWVSLRTTSKPEALKRAARLRYSTLPELLKAAVDKPTMLLDDVWEAYLKTPESQKLRASTATMKSIEWERFKKWAAKRVSDANKISKSDAEDYLKSLGREATVEEAGRKIKRWEPVSGKTYNNIRMTLSSIWSALGLDPNPWQEVRSASVETEPFRPLADAEVSAILKACEGSFWRQAVLISFYTGLRRGDIIMLKWKSIKEDFKYFELWPSKTLRTGRAVYIPIHPALKLELQAMRAKAGRSEYLFPAEAAQYEKDPSRFAVQFRRLLAPLKFDGKVGFHSLRDTFTTRAAIHGIDRNEIRAMAGHTTQKMTDHYIDSPETLSLSSYPELQP